MGCLTDARVMRSRLVPGGCIPVKARTQNAHPYHCFIVEIPWTPHLRAAFARQLSFLRQVRQAPTRVYIEKTDVVFLTWQELDSSAVPKRGVFHATLNQHRETFESIVRSGAPGWQALCDLTAGAFPT